MSGDVQPRKRKDKRRKRDSLDSRKSEADIFSRKFSVKEDDESKESHHGVHAAKLGSDDVLLHVQGEHVTGGHWCAKILFFSLLAILAGLIGLIIMENRGLSDMDTPLSESRYSEYFEGWVDEHRQTHDEHEAIPVVDDHDTEPFEEEEDHSEQDEGVDDHDDENEHDAGQDDDADEHHHDQYENDEDEEEKEEIHPEKDNEDDDTENQEEKDNNDEEKLEEELESRMYSRVQRDVNENADNDDKDAPDDDDVDEGIGDEIGDDNEDVDKDDGDEQPEITKYDFQNENDPFDETKKARKMKNESQQNELTPNILKKQVDILYEKVAVLQKSIKKLKYMTNIENILEKPKVEDENDEDSSELVIDNDAEELAHLERKAKEQEKESSEKQNDEEENVSNSLAVKVIVGLALVLVARLVFIKKTDKNEESVDEAALMKRRLTMVTAEEPIPWDDDEKADDLEKEEEFDSSFVRRYTYFGDEEDNEEQNIEHDVPKTFEQMHAMYRPRNVENLLNLKEEATNDEKSQEEFQTSPKIEQKQQRQQQQIQQRYPTTTIIDQLEELRQSRMRNDNEVQNKIRIEEELPKRIVPELGESVKSLQRENTPSISFPRNLHQQSNVKIYENEVQKEEEGEEDENGNGQNLIDYDEEEEDIEDEEDELGDDEEEEVEEISDVDDEDLMKRLEEKYGKLPESKEYDSEEDDEEEDFEDRSWTKIKSRTGHQNFYDDDDLINEQLKRAEEERLRNNLKLSLKIYESILLEYPDNPGALYGKAKVLDSLSEKYQSNHMLTEAIEAYKRFLAIIDIDDDDHSDHSGRELLRTKISNETFKEAAERCINRMRFKGLHLQAIHIHEMLIKRFPDDPYFRNQLAVTYLLINRLADAKNVLQKILSRWPNDGFAQVHYGFILKNLDRNLKEAVKYLRSGIESNENGTQDGRFYFHLGDALQRLGKKDEAKSIYRKGAELQLFLSEYQRSLYNVNGLKAKPFWTANETNYEKFFELLQQNWRTIRNEGLNILNSKGLFTDEVENLKDIGDWKQFELFVRGLKNSKNCQRAPVTCKLIETFPAARNCKRGQTKFSVMHPGTHVWPHCGPTNCRLRAHLGLKVPSGTKIRVADEEKTWHEGEFLIFDDSFEHEVWHNGTDLRLVLIVDVWHPELTYEQQKTLTPI